MKIQSEDSTLEKNLNSHAKTRQHHKLALVVIAGAQLMVMLDLTIVNIALPSMQHDLHFSPTNLTWVIDAYVLAFGGFLLLGGKAGDLFGRRKFFLIGIGLFTLSSFFGGIADSQLWLIIARSFQGIGAAIASPTALALIATIFKEGPERNKAMAVYAGMSATGGALGLLLGGFLVDYFSWRWVLFVNVPIGVLILAITLVTIPYQSGSKVKIDVFGAITISTGMAFLVFGLLKVAESSWSSRTPELSFAAAFILILTFIFIEIKSDYPIIPLKFLANRNRLGGYLVMIFLGGSMLSLIYFLTQFMQEILGYSPILTGVAYTPIPVAVGVTSLIVSKVIKRTGYHIFMIIGPVLVFFGLLLASRISLSTTYVDIFIPLVFIGIGMGFSFLPLTLNAVSSVPRHQAGLASALLNTSQQIGGSLGLAILVTIYSTAFKSKLRSLSSGSKSFNQFHHYSTELTNLAIIHGYDSALIVSALGAFFAFIIAAFSIRKSSKLPTDNLELTVP